MLALFPDDARKDQDRLTDNSPRLFKISATLEKVPPTNEHLRGDITPNGGGSYIYGSDWREKIQLAGSRSKFSDHKNQTGGFYFVKFEYVATGIFEARCLFQQAVLPMLDLT